MKFLLRSPPKPHHYHHQSRRSFGDDTVKRVRDRGLEHAVEKERSLKPMLNIKNLIKSEPSKSLPISVISQNKEALGLWTRPIDFIRRFPSIFEEFLPGGIGIHPHVRLTPEVLSLDGEELSIFQTENCRKQAADRLLKLLMLSRINKIPLSIVDRLKWDLGLPQDYVETLVPDFPDYFQVTSAEDHFSGSRGMRVLELVCWSNELAISVMEKNAMAGEGGFEKGMAIAFPLHFSRGFEMDKKMKKWVDEWQKLAYISPYENALHLPPKSDESDKWAVGLLHELLHLFVPKKTDKDNILCLGEYMGLRSRFKRALVNHPGIFYLSPRIGMHTVLLKEAYKRDLLIEKHPLMEMRYQYIHLMNIVKEDHKPINAPGTSPKKEQKNTSDARGEKSEQAEGGESEEESDGELHSDGEEASDDDYDDEDEDEDEDDEIETHRDARQNVAANRRTTRKVNFDARGPSRYPVQERSGGRYSGAREGQRYSGAREGQRYSGAREGQRYSGAREGQRYPGAREGQRYSSAREGERYPGAREGQRYPGAREGQRYPATREGQRYSGAREGQTYPGARDGQRYPSAREGQRYPSAREGQRYPGAREGQRYPATREGLRSGKREGKMSPKVSKRAEMYNGDKVRGRSSEKSNFPRSRGRSLADKRASFQ